MADIERILIVGGGIAGLSVATALHRQGFSPQLVERSTTWPAVGAGINLPAHGVRVLRALGLGEAVDRTAAVVDRWAFFDQQGELLCETDLEDLWRDVGPCLGITRVRLQQALLSGAVPVVPHRLGVSLTALTQSDDQVCDWVQNQSRAAARGWVLPPAARNAALRERGDEMFRDRYRPLIPAP